MYPNEYATSNDVDDDARLVRVGDANAHVTYRLGNYTFGDYGDYRHYRLKIAKIQKNTRKYLGARESLRNMGFTADVDDSDYDLDMMDGKYALKLILCSLSTTKNELFGDGPPTDKLASFLKSNERAIDEKVACIVSMGFKRIEGIESERVDQPFMGLLIFNYYILFYC